MTKSRKATKTHPDGLTSQQLQAAIMLGGGLSITKTAESVGVNRHAVWEWMQKPAFQAESAKMREETVRAAKERIVSTMLEAADVLADAMRATKPIYLKDDKGFAPVEDVPDHNARIAAATRILDRGGIPPKVEAASDDPFKDLLDEIGRRTKK